MMPETPHKSKPATSRRLSIIVAGDTKEFLDREFGPSAWHLLADNGFIDRTSVGAVGFCRNLADNSLTAILPKAYTACEDRSILTAPQRKHEHVYRLIRVFNKINRETKLDTRVIKSNRSTDQIEAGSDPVLDSLEAALSLRDDYKRNALYYRREPRLVDSAYNLPINWAKTLQRNTPYLNGTDVFIPTTIHNSRRRNLSHPLSKLHVACLKEIFELTGEKTMLAEVDKKSFSMPKAAKTRPVQYLKQIRSDIFDERGRFLLKTILAYLGAGKIKSTFVSDRDRLLSYTADFENIWEHILRKLFAPEMENRNLPKGKWYEFPSVDPHLKGGIGPEIDVRIKSDNGNAIIDAKDYRVVNGARLQGSSSDHYKQVIYRLLLKPEEQSKTLNILVFPGISQGRLFQINGCHHWTEIPNSRVFEVSVDYEIAVKRWMGEIALDTSAEVSSLLKSLREFETILINT
jgi:LlaJI restriction endonuclease